MNKIVLNSYPSEVKENNTVKKIDLSRIER